MSTHNIGFYEDLTKVIFELSSNLIKYAPYFFCCVWKPCRQIFLQTFFFLIPQLETHFSSVNVSNTIFQMRRCILFLNVLLVSAPLELIEAASLNCFAMYVNIHVCTFWPCEFGLNYKPVYKPGVLFMGQRQTE